MTRKLLLTAVVLISLTLGFPAPVAANGTVELVRPVAVYVGKKLLSIAEGKVVGAVVDPVWDAVTGKPDLKLLERRLRELEGNAALRSELRDEIRKLREGLNDRVTRDEFRKMVERTSAEIGSIQRRLDDLEERVEKLEVENEDLKNRTKNATDAEFFLTRGERYEKEKHRYKAIACYNIAIRLAPGDANLYCKRCSYYITLGAPGVGIPDATEAIRLDPKNATAYRYRGKGKLHEQDVGGAIADFAEASRLDPGYSDPSYNRTRAAAYTGRGVTFVSFKLTYMEVPEENYDKAVADFTEAVRLDPKCAEAYYQRGKVHSTRKKYDSAVSDLTAAIRLDPNHAEAYLARAHAHNYGTKDYDQAIDDYTQAIRLGPKDQWDFSRDAYVGRSHAYSSKGDKTRAEINHAEAIRLVAEARKKNGGQLPAPRWSKR